MTSPDGVTWTRQDNPLDYVSDLQAGGLLPKSPNLAYNGSYLLMCAAVASGNYIASSPDGVTWTQITTTGYTAFQPQALAWSSSSSFWAAYGVDTGTSAYVFATSPDGVAWTMSASGAQQGSDMVWDATNLLFLATASTSPTPARRCRSTPDGNTWTSSHRLRQKPMASLPGPASMSSWVGSGRHRSPPRPTARRGRLRPSPSRTQRQSPERRQTARTGGRVPGSTTRVDRPSGSSSVPGLTGMVRGSRRGMRPALVVTPSGRTTSLIRRISANGSSPDYLRCRAIFLRS